MEGSQDKRDGGSVNKSDDPSKPTTSENTIFEQRKIPQPQSEEAKIRACAERLTLPKQTNAHCIDQTAEPGQLPDMPASLRDKEPMSSPLLSPSTPLSKTVTELSGTSSRDRVVTNPHAPIIVDEDPVEYQRVHLFSDGDHPEQAEEVLSARRISKSNPVKQLRKELSEHVSSAMLNSAEVDNLTSATSDEHEEKVVEEAKNAPTRRPPIWDFGSTYLRRSRLPPPLPKVPEPSTTPPGRPAQMVHKQKPGGPGLVPRNNLKGDIHNKPPNPPYKNPTRLDNPDSKAFDFHQEPRHAKIRPEQVGVKRQRLNDGSSNHQGSSRSPIDLEHGQKGPGASNASQIYSSTSRHTYHKHGGVSEYSQVENTVKSATRARRRKSISSENRSNGVDGQKDYLSARNQSRSFKHGDIENAGEDPQDRISDEEPQLPVHAVKRPKVPMVEIRSRAPAKSLIINEEVTALENSKEASNARSSRSSGVSLVESNHMSPYFGETSNGQQPPNRSRPRSKHSMSADGAGIGRAKQQGKGLTARARSPSDNQEHDLSPDELAGAPPDSSDRNNQQVAMVLINNAKESKKSQQRPTSSSSRQQSVVISDSEDEEQLKKNDIKSTVFTSSKKSRAPRAKSEYIFQVKQAFSLSRKWISSGGSTGSMRLNTNTETIMVMANSGVPFKDLSLTPKCVNKIIFNKASSKIVLLKPAAGTAPGSHQIMLELGSPSDVQKFVENMAAYSSTMSIVSKEVEHLDKLFTNQWSKLDKEKRTIKATDDEIDFIKKKSEDRNAKHQSSIQENKRVTGGRRLIDDMVVADPQPHLQQNASDSTNHSGYRENENQPRRKSVLSPDTFYGQSTDRAVEPNATHSTRSSTRIQTRGQIIPPPPPETTVPRWSEANQGWAKAYKWKKSVVYPHEGKNKTTVDEQDIPRLDEDEFLNDNLIHFYFNFLERRLLDRNPETAKRVLFMNSFFYLRLTSGVPGKGGINYDAVERWTAKFNVFEYDYIVVPVNEAAHWYLAIICNAPKLITPTLEPGSEGRELEPETQSSLNPPGDERPGPEVDEQLREMSLNDENPHLKVAGTMEDSVHATEPTINAQTTSDATPSKNVAVESIDLTQPVKQKLGKKNKRKSMPSPRRIDTSRPRIITLDSLGGTHSSTCVNLKRWLIAEAQSKKGFTITDGGPPGMSAKHIPQQPNFCDCGVYLLMYLEKFLDDPDSIATRIISDQYKNNPMKLPDASNKRNEIRDLLLHLQSNPTATMEELMVVARKSYPQHIDNQGSSFLDDEIACQSEKEQPQDAHSKSNAQGSNLNPAREAQNLEQIQHSRLPQNLQTGPVKTKNMVDESQENHNEEVSTSRSILKRIKSAGSAAIAGIAEFADKIPGNRQDKSAHGTQTLRGLRTSPRSSAKSRSADHRPIELSESLDESPRQHSKSVAGTQSVEIDLRSPDSKSRASQTPRRDGGRITNCIVRSAETESSEKPPERFSSPHSSNTHTVDYGEEEESHGDNLIPRKTLIEIVDSQDDDADMLLNSKGHSEEGNQGANRLTNQHITPDLLANDISGHGPFTQGKVNVRDPASTSLLGRSQQPETEHSLAITPSRTRKRKSEPEVLTSEIEQLPNARPAKIRKHKSADIHEVFEDQTNVQEPVDAFRDSSDRSVVGKHKKQSSHIHFEE